MGGEVSSQEHARREAVKLRKELLLKGFRTPSAKILGITPFNILVMGEVGSGKSCAINTFVTAMHDDAECYLPALSLNLPDDNVTPFYKRYALHPKSDLMLYDSWGIYLGQNYVDESLRRMLEGRMEDGGAVRGQVYPERETTSLNGPTPPPPYHQGDALSPEANTAPARKRQIHMVVFCADVRKPWAQQGNTSPSDFDILSKMASLMKEIHETSDICAAILMTCTDTLGHRVMECRTPEEIRKVPEVDARLENISRATGVPKMIILPMLSNFGEFKRTPIIDLNALHVLKMLMRIAESHMEQRVSQRTFDSLY